MNRKTNDQLVNHCKDSQTETLLMFESKLGIGPVAAARKLDTPYDTYKDWKSGRHKMPGCAYVALELWIGIQV